MKIYAVGPIVTQRVGYCQAIVDKRKTRAKYTQRGTYLLSRSVDIPTMTAVCRNVNKPVHFLATGAAACASSVKRRQRGVVDTVPCLKLVRDYHDMMGGVDRHDQLQLQRYSLQLQNKLVKYYKSLFFGLIDLAIVNCFVTHTAC